MRESASPVLSKRRSLATCVTVLMWVLGCPSAELIDPTESGGDATGTTDTRAPEDLRYQDGPTAPDLVDADDPADAGDTAIDVRSDRTPDAIVPADVSQDGSTPRDAAFDEDRSGSTDGPDDVATDPDQTSAPDLIIEPDATTDPDTLIDPEVAVIPDVVPEPDPDVVSEPDLPPDPDLVVEPDLPPPVCEAQTTGPTIVASVSGAGMDIPDGTYTGGVSTMACLTLSVDVPADAVIVTMTAEASIDHTWAGDLVIKLIHPSGTLLTLLSRPGLTEVSDTGGAAAGCCGNPSNVSTAFPVRLDDFAPRDAETLGNGLPNPATVCDADGIGVPCEWRPNAGITATPSLCSLTGTPAAGDWRLCVGDGYVEDSGVLEAASLRIWTQ